MHNTSPKTPQELGDAFLSQLRAEHAAAVARANQATIEAERLTSEAEKLGGALEAAERFVFETYGPEAPILGSEDTVAPLAQSTAEKPEIDRAQSFVVVPRHRSVTIVRNENWRGLLRNMTQKQALVAIAEHSGGVLDVTKARDIFMEFGISVSKNPRTVYGVIHTLLRASDRFEKVGSGEFRLIPALNGRTGQTQPLLPDWRTNGEQS